MDIAPSQTGMVNGMPPTGTKPPEFSRLDAVIARVLETTVSRTPEQLETDRLRREKEQQDAEAEARYQRLAAVFKYGAGPRYYKASFATYKIEHAAQEKVLRALKEYAANIEEHVKAGRGIVLFGPSGTGKDHLLYSVARVAAEKGFHIRVENGLDLFGDMRDLITREGSEEEFIDNLCRPNVLLLSDPLPPSGSVTEFQASVLLRIVDRRYRSLKPTWVSMNVADGAEAESRMGVACVDRLRHDALTLFCDWPTYRRAFGTKEADA